MRILGSQRLHVFGERLADYVQCAQRITICDCSGLSILRLPTSSQTNRGVIGHLHADMVPSWKDFSATEKTTVPVVSVFRISSRCVLRRACF